MNVVAATGLPGLSSVFGPWMNSISTPISVRDGMRLLLSTDELLRLEMIEKKEVDVSMRLNASSRLA